MSYLADTSTQKPFKIQQKPDQTTVDNRTNLDRQRDSDLDLFSDDAFSSECCYVLGYN